LKVTFLGTGTSQGIPVIACQCNVCRSNDPRDKRMRTALMIEEGTDRIVIDTGPDFRQQMLNHKVFDISAVLLTHEHNDHIAGLDDLRSFNFATGKSVPIWAEKRVLDVITNQFPYVFAENKYPGVPDLSLHEIVGNSFKIGELEVEPIRLMHYQLPVFGFRIGTVAFLTDVSHIPDTEWEKLLDLDLLIIDALRIRPHISHFNLDQALSVIERLKPRQAYLVHMSHLLGKHTEIEKMLPDNVYPAWDGIQLTI
jgi:phosphoribosyl 1,2-cyclic phosphate phosphodiesterase